MGDGRKGSGFSSMIDLCLINILEGIVVDHVDKNYDPINFILRTP